MTLPELVDLEIWAGRFVVVPEDEGSSHCYQVVTREGSVNPEGHYSEWYFLDMCKVCAGNGLAGDTGFRCLFCGHSFDIESGPNRIINTPFGEIAVNSIGERI